MSMDSIPNEVVPYHISNGVVKPSTGDCRRRKNFSELHMTLSEALEKLQAKGLLSHWILSQYHILCLEDTILMLIVDIIKGKAIQLMDVIA